MKKNLKKTRNHVLTIFTFYLQLMTPESNPLATSPGRRTSAPSSANATS